MSSRRRGRRRHPAAGRRRQPAPHLRRPPSAQSRATRSTSRCSGHARSCRAGGRPPPITVARGARRGASDARQPGLRDRPLGAVRSRTDSPRHRRGGRSPRRGATLEQLWLAEAGRNNVLPMDDGLATRLGAMIFPAYPPGPPKTFLPGRPDHRRGRPPARRRVRHHGRRGGPVPRPAGRVVRARRLEWRLRPLRRRRAAAVHLRPRRRARDRVRRLGAAGGRASHRRGVHAGDDGRGDLHPVPRWRGRRNRSLPRRAAVRPPARRDGLASGF